VNDFHQIEAENPVGLGQGAGQALGVRDIVSGGQQMASIETVCEGKIGFAGGEVANRTQILEAAFRSGSRLRPCFRATPTGRERESRAPPRRVRARMRPGLRRATGLCNCRDAAPGIRRR
jgi:hypothetical protein